MATDIKAWRETLTQEFTLPSGNVARLKRVGLMDLVEQGGIPDTLSGQALKVAQLGPGKLLSGQEMHEFADVVNLVIKACFVSPRVAEEPGEDCLGVHEIPFVDRSEVFRWANEAAQRLAPFRPESA